jgi:hypothetical protein
MVLLGHTSTKYLWLYVQLAHIYFSGTPKYSSIWVTDREQESKSPTTVTYILELIPETQQACTEKRSIQEHN